MMTWLKKWNIKIKIGKEISTFNNTENWKKLILVSKVKPLQIKQETAFQFMNSIKPIFSLLIINKLYTWNSLSPFL